MNLPSEDLIRNPKPDPRLRGTESTANTYGLTKYMLDKHPTKEEIRQHIKAFLSSDKTKPLVRHGNYAGPNWSDGRVQESVAGRMLAASDLDQMSRDHDAAFSTKDSKTIKKANEVFIKAAFAPSTPVRTKLAGLAVLIASKLYPERYGGKHKPVTGHQPAPATKPKTSQNKQKQNKNDKHKNTAPSPVMVEAGVTGVSLPTGIGNHPRIDDGMSKNAGGRKIDPRPVKVATDIKLYTTTMSNNLLKQPANRRRQTSATQARVGNSRATAPLNTSRQISIPKAKMSTVNGVTSVKHSEYFRPVFGTEAYAVASNSINPALQTFPWLSTIAGSYQKYKFTSLKFRYVASCSATVGGRVCMAHQLDAADPVPANKGAMFQINPNVEVSAWNEITLSVNQKGGSLFTRSLTTVGTDVKTYDYGNLLLSTDNCTTTSVIGDLFVDYTVQLFDPQPSPEVGGQLDTLIPTPFHPFTGSSVVGPSPAYPNSNGDLIFPNMGTYMLVIFLIGTGITSTNVPTSDNATITGKFSTISSAATQATAVFIVIVTEPNAVVQYTPTLTTITRTLTLITKAALIMGN